MLTPTNTPRYNQFVASEDSINVQNVPDVPLQEELPTDNKVVAKYEYKGEPDEQNSIDVPDVQDVPDVPPQEELLADNVVLTKYKYSHSGNVMTNQTETKDVAKMHAYMDEAYKKQSAVPETITQNAPQNYDIPSQMGD